MDEHHLAYEAELTPEELEGRRRRDITRRIVVIIVVVAIIVALVVPLVVRVVRTPTEPDHIVAVHTPSESRMMLV